MKPVFVSILIVLLLLATTTHLYAHVERYHYLKGKLGQHELVVKMLCYDEMPTRHVYYFFDHDKRDHYLAGKSTEGVWEFRPEDKQYTATAKTLLAITEHKNGEWNGSFTDSTGAETSLLLRPIQTDSIASPFKNLMAVNEMNPYEQYRLANLHFTKTRTEKYGKSLMAEWWLDKQSGIEFFRLQSLDKTLVLDSINATLTTAHLAMVEGLYQYHPAGIPPHLESKITYLSTTFLSYQTAAPLPGPATSITLQKQFATLYLHNGQPVNLEDLIWFGDPAERPEPSDLFKIYKYRNSTFAPKIFALLQQLYPGKMQSDSCGINRAENWALPVWSLTNSGIAFSLKGADRCAVADWAILPYNGLKPYLQGHYFL